MLGVKSHVSGERFQCNPANKSQDNLSYPLTFAQAATWTDTVRLRIDAITASLQDQTEFQSAKIHKTFFHLCPED
jgi:hypothetical protein